MVLLAGMIFQIGRIVLGSIPILDFCKILVRIFVIRSINKSNNSNSSSNSSSSTIVFRLRVDGEVHLLVAWKVCQRRIGWGILVEISGSARSFGGR